MRRADSTTAVGGSGERPETTTSAHVEEQAVERPWGIYLHVPFCRTRCRYCDFYRVGDNAERQQAFVEAVLRQIDSLPYQRNSIDTVFFGGGTPSLLSEEQLGRVLERLRTRFSWSEPCEVTLEGNPSDLSQARLRGYRAAGVNRLSVGVQSLRDGELALLGRRHDARRARQVVRWARQVGFDNLSVDVMVGIPGQSRAGFRATLDGVVALSPDHVSAYLLEVHTGTEFDALLRERPGLFPSEKGQVWRYREMVERLGDAGYEQYEISNFSRPGKASRHNLKYWRREPYLGLGPSAHSQLGRRRWRQAPDLNAYLQEPTARDWHERVSDDEPVFLGLRLAEGVATSKLAGALGVTEARLREELDRLAPFLSVEAGRARFTIEGYLVSNAVLTDLLALGRVGSDVSSPAGFR